MIRIKLFLLSFLITVSACKRVPITGRKQLNMLPETTLIEMSESNYRQVLAQTPQVSASDPASVMVKEVGSRIAAAVTDFMKSKGQMYRLKGYKWEFSLIREDSVANAWCMPGGKVAVYTGLLPVTADETGLAVVMGHEIAHAIGRHGNERMSQLLLVEMGGMGLSVALAKKSQQTQNLFLQAYGISSTLGVLKYSRTHESEADKLGLIFMAMAGYNPQQAVDFWERMARQGGPKPPEILSTHPSDETRIKDIRKFLPTAMKYYKNPIVRANG